MILLCLQSHPCTEFTNDSKADGLIPIILSSFVAAGLTKLTGAGDTFSTCDWPAVRSVMQFLSLQSDYFLKNVTAVCQ
jgi:hypothetical protein